MRRAVEHAETARPGRALLGKACLVTGAGRDLSAAIADGLAREGALLGIHYNRSKAGAMRLQRQIIRRGGIAHVVQADLRDETAVRRMVRQAHRLLGRIDILVNSAGLFYRSDLFDTPMRSLDLLFDLNLKAALICARECAAVMTRQGSGCIVNISSLGAFEAWPGYLGYCASKAALVSATRTMALQLAPAITVNSVAPGFIDLPSELSLAARRRIIAKIPAARLGSYDDVVGAVLYLCRSPYVTGQVLLVDGGASIRHQAPGISDRYR
ncbi:MAG: SDR family oxidoreductase [Acidobacteriota bacterium]